MPIVIGSNIASLRLQRALDQSSQSLQRVFERLSSGQRINRASDDAAGLAISSSLRADSRVFSQAVRNVNDGISLLNTQDGALDQLSNVLIRQRELATQAANGTISLKQRLSLQEEFHSLSQEYNRILSTTEFNGISLFGNIGASMRIQAGYGTENTVGFNFAEEISREVGDGTFESTATNLFPFAAGTDSTVFGDVNGDGIDDILTFDKDSTGPGGVLHLGNADGTYTEAATLFASDIFEAPGFVKLEDVNGDGHLDAALLISGNSFGSNYTISVKLGNGDGTFGSTTTNNISPQLNGTNVRDFQIADINGDGVTDFAVSTTSGQVGFYGNGDGSVGGNITLSTSSALHTLNLGDFNGDGLTDYIRNNGVNLEIMLNQGGGNFSVSQTISGYVAQAASVSDINQDGIDDFVVENSSGEIRVFTASGDGSFVQTESFSTGHALVFNNHFVDINNDGFEDLVEMNRVGSMSTYLGNGDGTFQDGVLAAGLPVLGATHVPLLFRDFDGDGVVEVADAQLRVFDANTELSADFGQYSLTTQEKARFAMDEIDAALTRVSSERGAVGALQSRLATTANVLLASGENYRAAESRIVDADVAKEAAELLRYNILQQAASTILAQANQQPAIAISLISNAG